MEKNLRKDTNKLIQGMDAMMLDVDEQEQHLSKQNKYLNKSTATKGAKKTKPNKTTFKRIKQDDRKKYITAKQQKQDKLDKGAAKLLDNIVDNAKREKERRETITMEKAVEFLKNNKISEIIVSGKERKITEKEKKLFKTKERKERLKNMNGKILTWDQDLDTRMALWLLNDFNKKGEPRNGNIYDEGAKSTILNTHQKEKKPAETSKGLRVFIDAGGEWLKFEEDGKTKTLWIDHHGTGTHEATSGSKMTYEIMEKADLLKENPEWLKKLIAFINDVDNLEYIKRENKYGKKIFNETYFRNEWPNSLYSLAEKEIPLGTLLELCKSGLIKDPSVPFTEEELAGDLGKTKIGNSTISELCKKQRRAVGYVLRGIKKSARINERANLNLETVSLGKIIYHNYPKNKDGSINKIPDHLAFKATKAKGFDTYVAWNPKEHKFYINSNHPNLSAIVEQLNKADPYCATDIRGVMVFGKIKNLTEKQFLDIIDPSILANVQLPEDSGEPVNSIATVEVDDNDSIKIEDAQDHMNEVTSRLKEVKERQAELAELIQFPSNTEAIEENNELIKEAESLEEELEKIKAEFPELEDDQEEQEVEKEEEVEMSELREELKEAEEKGNEEEIEIIENKIRALENKIRGEKTKLPKPEQTPAEKAEEEKPIENKKLIDDLRKAEEEEAEKKEGEKIEQKLDEARDKYFEEYKQCKKEADRQSLISKTKNTILNFFRSKENKKQIKVEDFFTDKLRESKKEYDKSRVEMGDYMYNKRKAELEKAGLSGKDLENALIQYKAVEVLGKTIIEERQKFIDIKAERAPIKPALWKKLVGGFMKLKPHWKRIAVCTLIFLPLSASGALGASAIAAGGFGLGLAGLAAGKFLASMAIGYGVGFLSEGIDLAKRKSDKEFAEIQNNNKLKLKEGFSNDQISLEEYEKGMDIIEKEEKKRARNRKILKGVVGGALALTAGFVAYDAMGHGIEQISGVDNTVDAISGPDVSHITDTTPKIEHLNIEATADHGQGGIALAHELKENLKIEYGDNLENAPLSVKHALGVSDQDLAKELGMYKPGQEMESANLMEGDKIIVDGKTGEFRFDSIRSDKDVILQHGTETEPSGSYEGKMFDSDHSGVKIEDTDNTAGTSDEYKLPPQVDPTTGEPVTTEADSANLVDDKYKLPPQVDPVTGKLPDSVPEGDEQQIATGESETGYTLTTEEMTEVKQTYEQNIDHIFSEGQQQPGGIWDKIQNRVSAEKLMEMDAENKISPEYKPLTDYMEKLKEASGLEPRGITPLNPEPETIPEYMNRALEKIQHEGKLDEIKLSGNEIIDQQTPETVETPEGENYSLPETYEEMVSESELVAWGIREVNIDNLKDLKELTEGYEGFPGQPPLRMIMENIEGKGLHAYATESVGETQIASQLSAEANMNSALSSLGARSGEYEFFKTLPNGNVKSLIIRFYK